MFEKKTKIVYPTLTNSVLWLCEQSKESNFSVHPLFVGIKIKEIITERILLETGAE